MWTTMSKSLQFETISLFNSLDIINRPSNCGRYGPVGELWVLLKGSLSCGCGWSQAPQLRHISELWVVALQRQPTTGPRRVVGCGWERKAQLCTTGPTTDRNPTTEGAGLCMCLEFAASGSAHILPLFSTPNMQKSCSIVCSAGRRTDR